MTSAGIRLCFDPHSGPGGLRSRAAGRLAPTGGLHWTGAAARALGATILLCGAAAAQPPIPDLQVETLGPHAELEARLRRFDPEQIRKVVRLVGLDDPGGSIRVVLAPEEADLARATPSWIAGLAHAPTSTVVLFPSRAPRYPHDSLESVLHHEIAHILVARAAGGAAVPRWFDEGLSTVAERAWTVEDRRQLAWALAVSRSVAMHDLDRLFVEGGRDASRAYALASAFVRDIMDRHGADVPARILASLARGVPFQDAFRAVTGEPLHEAEERFHARLGSWERWIPLLTSPFVLWSVMSVLALYAIWTARRRRHDRRQRWEEEEQEEEDEEEEREGTRTAAEAERGSPPLPPGDHP